MPSIKQIDWDRMPKVASQKRQLSNRAKCKLAKQRSIERKSSSFQPVLPNRDRYKLQHELSLLNLQIKELKNKQRQVVKDLKEIDRRNKQKKLKPISLYALELEGGYYYIGMSFYVEKRFKQHGHNKGATWTKLHKPIRIKEVRVTEFYDQDEAAKLEDDMTLEYALKYGSELVRGGGWCQSKPRWPAIITQNDIVK